MSVTVIVSIDTWGPVTDGEAEALPFVAVKEDEVLEDDEDELEELEAVTGEPSVDEVDDAGLVEGVSLKEDHGRDW